VIVDDLAFPAGVEVDPKLESKKRVSGDTNLNHDDSIPIFDLFGHRQECLFNISSILCGSFEERYGELVRKFL
jgi:hypothetical protein